MLLHIGGSINQYCLGGQFDSIRTDDALPSDPTVPLLGIL